MAATKLYLASFAAEPDRPAQSAANRAGPYRSWRRRNCDGGVQGGRHQRSAREAIDGGGGRKTEASGIGAMAGQDARRDWRVTIRSRQASCSPPTRKVRRRKPARVDAIRRVLANYPHQEAHSPYSHRSITSDVPGLDHSAFVAMLTQLFNDETGTAPDDVIVSGAQLTVQDKDAAKGLKTHLDAYARALGRSAWAMSIKCGCAANATCNRKPRARRC